MIDGDRALEYLKNKIINLINKGEIIATYDQSEGTISFYISDIVATNRPLLSLRLSNHHENFNNRERQRGELPQGDDNISIELYKPLENRRNRVRTNVTHFYSVSKPNVMPFSITTIEYPPEKMYPQDVNLIYQSILNWIKSVKQGARYIDPLNGTSRQADIKTHQANITLKREVTPAERNFYMRYGLGDSKIPRYNIIKEYNQNNCNRNMKDIYIPNKQNEDTPFGRVDLKSKKLIKKPKMNTGDNEGKIEKFSGEGRFKGNLKTENISRKQVVRLTESQLHNIIAESVKRVLRENEFEKKYDAARMQAAQRGKIWGMEMKNPQNEWEYGNIEFNPNTMEMSCMGATIQVEEDWDVYDALEQLSYELYELGYGNEE